MAAWPTAYQDVVGFALWPDDYGPRVRDRGFDVIANTILARRQRAETTGSAGNTLNGDGCGAAVDANWPSDRLQQSSDPAQAEDVNRLQAVVAQSAQNIGAACKKASTAPERLNSLISTLWAVRDGGNGIREPVKTLVADAKPTNVASDAAPAANANADPGQQQAAPAPDANADQNRQQACGAANIGASERMVREIEQRVRPNERQRPALEGLRTASTDMAKLLMASCMQPVAPTPLARLDAADDQLATLNYAALTVRIALNQLYASLDNGQKARLNAAAP
ncbi:MAG: Spy/CpxP family protein refolding chaperone [Pseudolabrys sp.]|nr:Spy/CpxP family protein refolding chaperone [Pseudolabrys sp.]